LTKVIEIKPEDADALNIKGNAVYNFGKYIDAIECFDKALEIGRP